MRHIQGPPGAEPMGAIFMQTEFGLQAIGTWTLPTDAIRACQRLCESDRQLSSGKWIPDFKRVPLLKDPPKIVNVDTP